MTMTENAPQTTKLKVEKVKRNCQSCGAEILAYPYEIKAGIKGKFCSHSCAAKSRTRRGFSVHEDYSTEFLWDDL